MGREESQGQTNKEGDPEGTAQPPPSPPRKDTQTYEKIKGKDEHPERSLESKPPEKVVIHDDYPDQTITIGGNLSTEYRSELIEILWKHADAFAWTPADMTGIPRFIAEHKLKTYPHIEPRVQRKRSIAPDKRKVANPVLVKKPDDSWRICIDFKDLNKACPKDRYPLSEIDWKIESLMGFKYKCFLDAYKGYDQIQMTKKNEEKTAFHTDKGVFCYTKMPFGLKNARATYQRLVDTIFEGQIGRNLEAYVDDMVIKSKTKLEMIKDIEETLLTLKKEAPEAKTPENLGTKADIWKLYTDGASNEHGSGVGLILIDPEGAKYSYALRLNFANSNNDAEYEALLAGLKIAAKMKVEKMHAFLDSKLLASQVEGSYEAKGEKTKKYKEKAIEMIRSFNNFQISHIPREDNKKMDALSKLAAVQCRGLTKGVLIEELNERSMDTAEVNTIVEEATRTWMTPIQEYIKYTRRCSHQAKYLIKEIHMGSCGMPDGPRRAVHKAMNVGYFCPSMHQDANNEVSSYDSCQVYPPVPKLPKNDMISVTSTWPFRKWGMDIVGPFPEAPGKVKYLIVAVDYFTKWIEAKAVTSITGRQVKNFIFDNIVCRFGLLATIITNNETQLINDPFKSWAEGLGIKLVSTSVYHPQANGAMERANRSIMQGIKTRLHQEGGAWVEEFPNVL
ncbi:reverse transcriptase domain-containing protein [Tanacetum coccineum]|uniref:Reverse transcriptase domain-containing protein n=1 Tax=Tanacetum coccineum TaxID=301880 RepID=A0ABQ5IXV5_9ASTR